MAVSRPTRSKAAIAQASSKPSTRSKSHSRLISPPASSQATDGSSPPRPECRVSKITRSKQVGLRTTIEKSSTACEEAAAPATRRKPAVKGQGAGTGAGTSAAKSGARNPASSPNEDAQRGRGSADTAGVRPVTQQEKVQILQLCYQRRKALLNCPTTAVGGDQAFWESVLEATKSQVRRDLPSYWSTWSGMKGVLLKECRTRHEQTRRRHASPRRADPAPRRELDSWMDRWFRVWKFHELQVFASGFTRTLQVVLGKRRLDSLTDDDGHKKVGASAGPSYALCLPPVAEAIHRYRAGIEKALVLPGSGYEELELDKEKQDDGEAEPYLSDDAATDDAATDMSGQPVGSDAAPSPEDLAETDEKVGKTRETRTPTRCQEPSVGRVGGRDKASSSEGQEPPQQRMRTRTVSVAGSAVLGSTPTTGRGRQKQREPAPPRSSPTPQGPTGPCPSKPDVDMTQERRRSVSVGDDDEELPELATVLFPTRQVPARQSSTSEKGMQGRNAASEGSLRGKTASLPRQKSSQLDEGMAGEIRATSEGRGPSSRTRKKSAPAQGRSASKTPALVKEENARVANKHPKPLAPVRVPHRHLPSRPPSPAQNQPGQAEVSAKAFYAQVSGAPPMRSAAQPAKEAPAEEVSRTGFMMPPPVETPSSVPDIPGAAIFREYETSPSPASPSVTRRVEKPPKADSSVAKEIQAIDEYIMSDSGAWYNQDSNIFFSSSSTSQGPGGDSTRLQEDTQPSTEQLPIAPDVRELPNLPAADQAPPDDPFPGLVGSHERGIASSSKRGASSSDKGTCAASKSSKSKKRKRDDHCSLEEEGSAACSPSTPRGSATNSPITSPSIGQCRKRQKRQLHRDSQEDAAKPRKADEDVLLQVGPVVTPVPITPTGLPPGSGTSSLGKRKRKQKSKGKKRAEKHRGLDERAPVGFPTGPGHRPTPYAATPPGPGCPFQQQQQHTPKREPISSPAVEPWWGRGPGERFTTPAMAAVPSPASSGLFVPSGSQSAYGGGGVHYRQPTGAMHRRFPERELPRATREGTACTEDFRHQPRTSQIKHLQKKLKKMKKTQQHFVQEYSMIEKRLRLCEQEA